MQQVKDKSKDAKKVTRFFGERPSQEVVVRMWANRYKGITYQKRKGNVPQVNKQSPVGFQRSNQPIQSSTKVHEVEPSTNVPLDMQFDITNWVSNVKVHIPLIKLAKFPSINMKLKELCSIEKVLEPSQVIDTNGYCLVSLQAMTQ